MQETETKSLTKLDLLEAKIGQTVKRLSELSSRCDTLKRNNEELTQELEGLRGTNRRLTEQIDQLIVDKETRSMEDGGKEEIIKRIDKMLEKFGELQI
jgi:FtsZ-binding cell division protein ZapB